MKLKLIAALLITALSAPAFATETGFQVAPGTTTVSPFTMFQNGSQLFPVHGLCDASNNCLIITPSGTLNTSTTIVGTVQTSTSITGTISANTALISCAPSVCNVNGAAAPSASAPVTPSNLAVGAGTLITSQITVGPGSFQIAAARTGVAGIGRVAITITNTTTNPVWLGPASTVTSANGAFLAGIVGASKTINTTSAIWGTSQTSSVLTEDETF